MTEHIDPNKLFRVGINLFIVRDGKLLLGKRKKGIGAGQWGLPGGHLEHGEAMLYTAIRELEEETGLKATSFSFCNVVNNVREDGHYVHIGFLANDVIGEPTNREPDKCEGWEWLDINNLPENLFIGHHKQIEMFKNNQQFTDA